MSAVLETRALRRTLGSGVRSEILRGIDLRVQRGEFLAITGHSGSGKSTLLYLMGVLDKPTSGEVLVEGVDVGALGDDERAALRNERIGYVFQFHFLLPEFSVVENVMIPMLRRRHTAESARQRAMETLAGLGLEKLATRKPGELSGGQQQRVAIARAIAGRPAVLLADEPTGSLDTQNGLIVFELFERLNKEEGMTIVFVTHDPDLAQRTQRQIVMKDGHIERERSG
jgi:lipoprotein-releasing system ATP-binding protein